MIINKNSWHYKVYDWTYRYGTPEHTSLCQYMRRLTFVPLCLVLLLVAETLLVQHFGKHVLAIEWHFLLIAICLLLGGAVGVGSFVGFLVLVEYIAESNNTQLFSQWVRAKKQGICPLVEFADDTKAPPSDTK
jgi:hypothetical protein